MRRDRTGEPIDDDTDDTPIPAPTPPADEPLTREQAIARIRDALHRKRITAEPDTDDEHRGHA